MPLFNVRLAAEDARLVRGLRDRGVSISELVRRAIRDAAHKARATETADVAGLLAEMLAAHPTPAGERPPPGADRRRVKRIIRAKLKRRS